MIKIKYLAPILPVLTLLIWSCKEKPRVQTSQKSSNSQLSSTTTKTQAKFTPPNSIDYEGPEVSSFSFSNERVALLDTISEVPSISAKNFILETSKILQNTKNLRAQKELESHSALAVLRHQIAIKLLTYLSEESINPSDAFDMLSKFKPLHYSPHDLAFLATTFEENHEKSFNLEESSENYRSAMILAEKISGNELFDSLEENPNGTDFHFIDTKNVPFAFSKIANEHLLWTSLTIYADYLSSGGSHQLRNEALSQDMLSILGIEKSQDQVPELELFGESSKIDPDTVSAVVSMMLSNSGF